MSLRDLTALALTQPSWAAGAGAAGPLHALGRLGRTTHAYPAVVGLATLLALALPGAQPSGDQMYAPLGIAVLIGWLLMVRLVPGQPGTALLVVPVMTVHARFGLAGVPLLAYTGVVAALLRGVRGTRVLTSAGHATVAYALAHGLARLSPAPEWVIFGVGFVGVRFVFAQLATRFDATPAGPRAEQPDLALSLALAPVGVLPVLVGDQLGDGPLTLSMAALLALLFVVREATNLATARAETEAERDRLARANALQDDLIHLMTHELRNPLTLVLSYSQMARRATQDGVYDSLPNYLAHVERAGKSIQRLIENLLQLSRLERSDALPEPEPVEPAAIINQVVADLAPLAKQKYQKLVVQPAQDTPCVLAVPMLLREALSNLVSNAVKYTPEGGEIVVWASRGKRAGTALLGVSDTGIGLSREDTDRLFTKFFRSNDPRVQRERGSGLGLALTQAMVSRMGGAIEVSSAPERGTTFRLVLPTKAA
ncbi:MAG TPA: HAMP domain-containing sensor histidine kinase [Chloroflexota bacterium]|nr:HAMP domain-containing sensor histidine kinase [Chloroflexota bacterium]